MMKTTVPTALFIAFSFLCPYASAQSDPSLFSLVINVPPSTAPAQIGSHTQLNLLPGGVLNSISGGPQSTFDAGVRGGDNENVEVNISGGVGAGIVANDGSVVNMSGGDIYLGTGIGFALRANSGSTVNVTGGRLQSRVGAFAGSTLDVSAGSLFSLLAEQDSNIRISGGRIVRDLFTRPGSHVEIVGGQFQLNGAPYSAENVTLIQNSGVLTGVLPDGSPIILSPSATDRLDNVKLTAVAVPPADLTPLVVTSATATPPIGLRTGQSLTLNSGQLPSGFRAIGAQLAINGGEVGFALRAVNTQIDVNGGEIGRDAYILPGSTVNVSGGRFGDGFAAFGAIVNVASGSIGSDALFLDGSTANITGGFVNSLGIVEHSVMNISAGLVGSSLRAYDGAVVNLSGGRIGDNSIAESGSVFNITGGEIGVNFTARTGSVVNISGGRLDGRPIGGEVRVQGGQVNVSGTAQLGRTVLSSTLGGLDVTGGAIGDNSWIAFGTMNLIGGSVGESLQVNGTLNVRGGSIGADLSVPQSGTVNLFMTEAFLNGEQIMAPRGVPFEILARDNAVLSGVLLDSTPLEFRMNSPAGNAYFNPFSTLTVTLIPEPGAFPLVITLACALAAAQRRPQQQPALATSTP